jgi:hypothetical protein
MDFHYIATIKDENNFEHCSILDNLDPELRNGAEKKTNKNFKICKLNHLIVKSSLKMHKAITRLY